MDKKKGKRSRKAEPKGPEEKHTRFLIKLTNITLRNSNVRHSGHDAERFTMHHASEAKGPEILLFIGLFTCKYMNFGAIFVFVFYTNLKFSLYIHELAITLIFDMNSKKYEIGKTY